MTKSIFKWIVISKRGRATLDDPFSCEIAFSPANQEDEAKIVLAVDGYPLPIQRRLTSHEMKLLRNWLIRQVGRPLSNRIAEFFGGMIVGLLIAGLAFGTYMSTL